MAQGRRDEFTPATKKILAERVGYCCSNPNCRRKTVGPNSNPKKSASIGEAAHIRAAAPKGPRYDPAMTQEERTSVENGIWLCRNCARLIDVDSNKYTIELLEQWKQKAEQNAQEEISTREGEKATKIEGLKNPSSAENSIAKDSCASSASKPKLFLSYCSKDECIANLIEDILNTETHDGIIISRYTRVPYRDSFKAFMNGIQDHNYVLSIVSDNYLKSQPCMYEVGEIVKDRTYKQKLLFVVLSENDRKYYPPNYSGSVAAKIYGEAKNRLEYTSFWKNKYCELEKSIDALDDKEASASAVAELKEVGRIYRNDINEFLAFLKDHNGKSFEELYTNHFSEIIKWIIPDCNYINIDIDNEVKKTIEKIQTCFPIDPDLKQFDNRFGRAIDQISHAIHRLQREYHRAILHPYGGILRADLEMQFWAVLGALKNVAEKARRRLRKNTTEKESIKRVFSKFFDDFNGIIEAFLKSMQAICQADRLGFQEQSSFLQNNASYFQVLYCFYGIIKDILTLMYGVDHTDGSEQYLLIPLISLDLSPTPSSIKYECSFDEREAYLVSITLPYQALTNPAKYLGILVHEVFHYASPSDRKKRNELVATYLTSAALSSFLDVLAENLIPGKSAHFGVHFFKDYSPIATEMTKRLREAIYKSINKELKKDANGKKDSHQTADTLRSAELKERVLNFFPAYSAADIKNSYYFQTWWRLRKQLLGNRSGWKEEEKIVFALEQEIPDAEVGKTIFNYFATEMTERQRNNLDAIVEQCEKAFGELRPDLFDIGVVMFEIDQKEQLIQYLWQIYDMEYHIGLFTAKEQHPSGMLDQIELRKGFVIEFLLKQATGSVAVRTLSRIINEQGAPIASIKNAIISDYQTYRAFSRPFSDIIMDMSKMIRLEIESLQQNHLYKPIIQKLTKYYHRYNDLRREFLRLPNIDSDQRNELENQMLGLCWDIIDHYKYQISFYELSNLILPSD